MLSQQENDLLTEVGRGTPMGELLRRYWQPIAASSELLERPTKAVRRLGENLVLFRDQQGRPGLIVAHSRHGRISMMIRIHAAQGLRCFYHVWRAGRDSKYVDL